MSAIGVNRLTVASSPACAARMTRLYRRSNRSRGDMLLMSGGVPSATAPLLPPLSEIPPAASATAAGVGEPRLIIRRSTPSSPASATPAMIHGVRSPPARPAPAPVRTSRPQEEQKRAPRANGALQLAQSVPSRGAPQAAQNRPVIAEPQATHMVWEALVMRSRDCRDGGWMKSSWIRAETQPTLAGDAATG